MTNSDFSRLFHTIYDLGNTLYTTASWFFGQLFNPLNYYFANTLEQLGVPTSIAHFIEKLPPISVATVFVSLFGGWFLVITIIKWFKEIFL